MNDEFAENLRTLRDFALRRRRKASAHAVALLDKDYLSGEINRFIEQIAEAQRDIEMFDRALADEKQIQS